MAENSKRAIWEAFLVAGFVFIAGFLLGFAFESNQISKMNDYYVNSEFSLMDAVALGSLVDGGSFNCSSVYGAYSGFADRIYEEAILLQRYESSEQITEEMKIVHRRYDLLRTILWANILKTYEECKNSPEIVVYLYEYNTDDLAKKATQNVWSKILSDLKNQEGDGIILIPIAVDLEINSLDVIKDSFNISSYPVVILGNNEKIYDLISSEELKKHLN